MSFSLCVRLPRRVAMFCALALMGLCAPAGGVVQGVTIPDGDRRFDAVGIVITRTPWTPCGGWVSGSCTLIGPDLVLLARHSVSEATGNLPAPYGQTHSVRFRRGRTGGSRNHVTGDPGQDCISEDMQEIAIREFIGAPAAGLDMVLARLESAPLGITPIGVEVEAAPTTNRQIILAGWGYDGRCIQSGDAWTLRYDGGQLPNQQYLSQVGFEYNRVTFEGSCMVWPTNTDWAIGNLHDSGAPIVVEVPNPNDPSRPQIRVLGVVTTFATAQRVSAWNLAGGRPALSNPRTTGCGADVNGSGSVTNEDLLLFIDWWLPRLPQADLDGSGAVTYSDFVIYLERYFRGC